MIYKGSDGKILTNVGGEILTVPPIVSLDSAYGITKDASNLVSSWKDENKAFKFTAPTGNEPTENGNGVEFNGVSTFLDSGVIPDYGKPFTMKIVYTPNVISRGVLFITGDYADRVDNWVTILLSNKVKVTFLQGGSRGVSKVETNSILSKIGILNEVLICYDGFSITTFQDGFTRSCDLQTINNPIKKATTLGKVPLRPTGGIHYNGSIQSVSFIAGSNPRYIAWDNVNQVVSKLGGFFAFTPTYLPLK